MSKQQTRQDYDDVYRAMSNDNNARQRLIDRGLITEDAKLIDLYRLGSALADKLTASGDNYVDLSAAQAEKELNKFANTGLTCLKCSHTWRPIKDKRPAVCPKCKSYSWDKPKIK